MPSLVGTATPQLPRRRVLAFGIAFLLLCVPLWSATSLLLTARLGLSGLVELFREGGAFAYLVALFATLAFIALAVLGFFAVAGRRVPAAALFVPAFAPLGIGIVGTASGLRIVERVLPAVDPSMRATLLAKALSESMSPLIIGALESGFALVALAALFAFTHLTIDGRRLAPAAAPAPAGATLALALGLVALAVSFAARFVLGAGASSIDLAVWVALLGAAVFARLAAAPLSRLFESDEGVFAWRNLAHVLPALAGGVGLLGYASLLLSRHQALVHLAGIDPSMRGILLAATAAEVHLRPQSIAVDVLCAIAAIALVVSRAPRALRRPDALGPSAIVTAVAGLALAGGIVWFEHVMSEESASASAATQALRRTDLQLPVSESATIDALGGPTLVFTGDGKALFDDASGAAPIPLATARPPAGDTDRDDPGTAPLLAADRAIPVDTIAEALRPFAGSAPRLAVALVVRPRASVPSPAGGLGAFAPPNLYQLNLVFELAPAARPSPLSLFVHVDRDGFTLGSKGGLVYADDVPGSLPTLSGKDPVAARLALTRMISRIKEQFPDETELTLHFARDIPVQSLADAVSAIAAGKPAFPTLLVVTRSQSVDALLRGDTPAGR